MNKQSYFRIKKLEPVKYEDILRIYNLLIDCLLVRFNPDQFTHHEYSINDEGTYYRVTSLEQTEVYILLYMTSYESYVKIYDHPLEEFKSEVLFLSHNKNYHRIHSKDYKNNSSYCISYRIYPRTRHHFDGKFNMDNILIDSLIDMFLSEDPITNNKENKIQWSITDRNKHRSNNTNIALFKEVA